MKTIIMAMACAGLVGCATVHPSAPAVSPEEAMHTCINNLRIIDSAKEVASIKDGYKQGDTIPEDKLSAYIRGGFDSLKCPSGGRYIPHPYGEQPECSEHGHLGGSWNPASEQNRKVISEQFNRQRP